MGPARGLIRHGLLAVALGLAPIAAAAAQQQVDEPPSISLWRWDEDYVPTAPGPDDPWWLAYKAMPLDADGDVHLSLGLDARVKGEAYRDEGWGDLPEGDRDYVWYRALPSADLRVGEHVQLFTQLIGAVEVGDEAGLSPIDEDRGDVLQAFAHVRGDVAGGELSVRAGRQVFELGSGRLVSTRYGPNVLFSFDVAQVAWQGEDVRAELLHARPVVVGDGGFDNRASDDEAFVALTTTWDLDLGDVAGLDVYLIDSRDGTAVYNEGAARDRRKTLGARFFGREGRWDWNHELFLQHGTFGDGDIRAWSVATSTGLTLPDAPGAPRVGLKLNAVSGDDTPGDGDLETFDPLYPKGKYFGEIGILGPYNMVNLHPSVDWTFAGGWSLGTAAVLYWRESTRDGVYDNAGNLLRPDGSSDERFTGTQLDLIAGWQANRNVDVVFAYSLFLAGAYLDDTGGDETVHFATLESRFRF